MFNTIFSKNNKIRVHQAAELAQSGNRVSMVLPLSLRLPNGDWWQLPIEPLISISGKNVVIKRNVAKSARRGTIKERWAEDDFKISIDGRLEHADLYTYPESDMLKLHSAITQRRAIEVKNELLQLLNVHQIVVESFDFPFTKGENVQNYSIEAYSDDLYELFIDVKNV